MTYLGYPYLFERLVFVFETGGSAGIRVLEPLKHVAENITLLGTDTSFMKSDGNVFFVNTFLYAFFSFGVIGLLLFISLISSLKFKYFYYTAGLMLAVVIEGLTGRVDFWMLLVLVLLIKSREYSYGEYRESANRIAAY